MKHGKFTSTDKNGNIWEREFRNGVHTDQLDNVAPLSASESSSEEVKQERLVESDSLQRLSA